jgi:heme-degrading monooxygenase HmoA
MMILRGWRGRASLAQAEVYRAHFRTKVVPELVKEPEFLGAHLSRRLLRDRIEFLVLTRWKSMDAIRDFAGSEMDHAVVEPGAVAALIDFDAKVQHYEVIEEA